ncbi:unnamed protein product, partial [Sphacelaria rigidula]
MSYFALPCVERRCNKPRTSASMDLQLGQEQEETRRYQEQRYYQASLNRVQRKLLRGRLAAFCMSRDYDKREQLQ